MSRRATYNASGHAHELTFSCYRRLPLLKSDRTCEWLCEAVNHARQSHNFAVWAYVIMPEHVHLIVAPLHSSYDMGTIRQAIKEPVARQAFQFLERHSPESIARLTRQRGKRTERLFWQSGAGYDRNITNSETLLTMMDYIHLNPVRRGLVPSASDWKWSSASWHLSQIPSPMTVDPIPPEWLS